MLITSRSNPAVKRFRALRDGGKEEGLCVLEGVKLLEEALDAGLPVVEAAVAPRLGGSPRGVALVERLARANLPMREVSDDVLASMSEVEQDQGVVAVARRRVFAEEALLVGTPLVLLVAGIQNPGNLGALLRTAEAAGATGAYLTGCADAWSWKALRGSMGSAFRLPHVTTDDAVAALARLRAHGVRIYATASTRALPHDQADLRRPTAIVLGNEGAGLDKELARAADATLSIPMAGRAESLNVAVAAGVLLFEAARQRRA
jgi:TrmH family RNA methyltransferase